MTEMSDSELEALEEPLQELADAMDAASEAEPLISPRAVAKLCKDVRTIRGGVHRAQFVAEADFLAYIEDGVTTAEWVYMHRPGGLAPRVFIGAGAGKPVYEVALTEYVPPGP